MMTSALRRLAGFALLLTLAAGARPAGPLPLLPWPEHLDRLDGPPFSIPAVLVVSAPGVARPEGEFLAEQLAAATGRPAAVEEGRPPSIRMDLAPDRVGLLGEEGYRLEISAAGVVITAARAAGLFYAGQTLLQLWPAPAGPDPARQALPALRIQDRPRFSWRGHLIDPARHFIPKPDVLRIVDALASLKINRLQMHLTDDQGWRIEIRKYPLLTERASTRKGTWRPGMGDWKEGRHDGIPHGGFYTQDDLREIVAYAARRHLVVVPEIEMPGHARAWISAYPDMAVDPGKARGLELWVHWGVSRDVLGMRPATLAMAKDILDEVCGIFPSPWIHIGGDEAPRDQWLASPEMRARARALGLESVHHLQGWFNREIAIHLAGRGRRLVGWDEIIEGGLRAPEGSVVMSWRGEQGGIAAARIGHDVIMAPHQWLYLDYAQGPPGEEPHSIGGDSSLLRVHAYDPHGALPPGSRARVLGLQSQAWGEYLPDPAQVEYMTFPRVCAVAERGWSRPAPDFPGFLFRLDAAMHRLAARGIRGRPLAKEVCAPDDRGILTAPAGKAVLHGKGIGRHVDPVQGECLGYWKSDTAFATWRLAVPRPGAYRVEVDYALSATGAGGTLRILAGAHCLEAAPAPTAGWLDFQTLRLDKEVDFPAPGPVLLAALPGRKSADAWMNVRSIRLIPVSRP